VNVAPAKIAGRGFTFRVIGSLPVEVHTRLGLSSASASVSAAALAAGLMGGTSDRAGTVLAALRQMITMAIERNARRNLGPL
jgi:hypothetical protein